MPTTRIRIKKPTMHKQKFNALVDAHHKRMLWLYRKREGCKSKSASEFLKLKEEKQRMHARRDMVAFLRNILRKIKSYAKEYSPEVGAKIYLGVICKEYEKVFGVEPNAELREDF